VANDILAVLALTLGVGFSQIVAPTSVEPIVVEQPPPAAPPAPPPPPKTEAPRPERILVNTATTLYDLDPDTLEITEVGQFQFVDGPDVMTDIALDRDGRLWGVSFDATYAIDSSTLVAHRLGRVPNGVNALGIVESADGDVLVAAGHKNRTVYRIDTTTGKATPVGDLRIGTSSGDIARYPGVGPLIVIRNDSGADLLARLDPHTFAATPIGSIGFEHVLGLAVSGSHLFGVTETGDVIDIDPATGAGRLRDHHGLRFYGAATGSPAPRRIATKPTIAILGVEAGASSNRDAAAALPVAQRISAGLRMQATHGRFALATSGDLVDEKLLADCDSEAPSCMAVLGRRLAADVLLWGRVEPAGAGYMVRLTLFDVSRRTVDATVTQLIAATDVDSAMLARFTQRMYSKLIPQR
jgi:hypothetical protein